MPAPTIVTVQQLARRIGLPDAPVLIDVRTEEDAAADPRFIPGADTGRPDLAPEAAGLLAASLGLSRMHRDDLVQLEAGLALYDAFYRWARDAADETHNWPTPGKPA